jgi:hypothetical protein
VRQEREQRAAAQGPAADPAAGARRAARGAHPEAEGQAVLIRDEDGRKLFAFPTSLDKEKGVWGEGGVRCAKNFFFSILARSLARSTREQG